MKLENFHIKELIIVGIILYASFSFGFMWNWMKNDSIMSSIIGLGGTGFIFFLIAKYQYAKKFPMSSKIISLIIISFFYFTSRIFVVLIHESGHFFTGFASHLYVQEVIIGLSGFVLFDDIKSNFVASRVNIAGALSIVIILILIMSILISYHNTLKPELFFPLYFVFGLHLVEEIRYWIRGILEKSNDAWLFLEGNPEINPFYALITLGIIFIVSIMLLTLISIYIFKKYKEHDTKIA